VPKGGVADPAERGSQLPMGGGYTVCPGRMAGRIGLRAGLRFGCAIAGLALCDRRAGGAYGGHRVLAGPGEKVISG
jgi:hypothetical protein